MDMEQSLQNLVLRNPTKEVLQRILFQHSSHILSSERAAPQSRCQFVQRAAGEEVAVKGNVRQKPFLHSNMDLQASAVPIPLIDHIIVGGDNREFFSFREKGMIDNPKITLSTDYWTLDIKSPLVAEQGKAR